MPSLCKNDQFARPVASWNITLEEKSKDCWWAQAVKNEESVLTNKRQVMDTKTKQKKLKLRRVDRCVFSSWKTDTDAEERWSKED